MLARGRGPEVHVDEPLAKFQRFLPKRFFFFLHAPRQFFSKFSHFLAPRPWREIFAAGGEPPSPSVDLTDGRMGPCRRC